MTLNQLKYVITLSKVNSINEAAKILFISQPSLTSSLKSLEEELGFDIFLRSKTGISLTVKGSEFLGYTLCSGIICEDLNGTDYCAIKLDTDEKMTIGYIKRKASVLSEIGKKYVEELSQYKERILE